MKNAVVAIRALKTRAANVMGRQMYIGYTL